MATLTVTGFTGHLCALNGVYQQQEINHGKPTYKKHAEVDGTTQCCVYFWDERDGEALSGWWMAPEVGGEQVWAHVISKNPTPPTRGWKVPWHSSTPDPKVIMELKQGLQNNVVKGGISKTLGGYIPTDPRARAQREKNMLQVNAGVTTAENALKKLANVLPFDKNRHVSMAKSAITSALRCVDGHVRTNGLDEVTVSPHRSRLKQLESDLKALEEAYSADQHNKLDSLKNNYVSELTDLVYKAEKLVERTKDAAALFTCEMAEHVKPEDAIEAKEKTDAESLPAAEALKRAKDLLFSKDREIRQFPPGEVASIRESIKPLNNRLCVADKELLSVKSQVASSVRKAQLLLAKKERERVAVWNKELLGFGYQVSLVVDALFASCDLSAGEQKYLEAEEEVLGIRDELVKRQEHLDCLPPTKLQLAEFVGKVESVLEQLRELLKDVADKNADSVRRMAVEVAVSAQEKKGQRCDDEYFELLTEKCPVLTLPQFEKFVRSLGLPCSCAPRLFREACMFVGPECTELTQDEFCLHVLHAYHVVLHPSLLQQEEDPESEVLDQLEEDSVVEVLEGPKEVRGVTRVRICTVDGVDGWTTLREQAEDFLARYSPHYVVVSETALTTTFELKDFKVIRRIQPEERVRAVRVPQRNEGALCRINALTENDENVWVTIKGNRGTPLLQNIPVCTSNGESTTTPKEFSEPRFNAQLENLAGCQLGGCTELVEKASAAKESIERILGELKAMDEEGKEPSEEEVSSLIQSLDDKFQEQKDAAAKASSFVKQLLQNLENVECGPFFHVREKLAQFETALFVDMDALLDLQSTLVKSVVQKEFVRRQAREKLEQEALVRKLLIEVKPYEVKVKDIGARIEDLESRAPPTLADALKDYTEKLTRMKKDVEVLEALTKEAKDWLEENTPKSGEGILCEPQHELSRLRSRCTSFLYKCRKKAYEARVLEYDLKEKIRVDFALALKAYMTKKGKTASQVFDVVFKNAASVDLNTFSAFARKLCKDVPCFEAMLQSAVGTTTVAKEHFEVLSATSYRCLKRALITDTIEIKSCKRLRKVEPEEIVEVLKRHEVDASTNLIRFRGRVSDGVEGYVTIRGNKGSTFFRLQQNGYRVVKETVFTNKLEMTDFTVLHRLQEGEFLRGLTNPQLEEKSKLWRMKAQSLNGKGTEVGWVTLRGNQGSTFLVNCDLPDEQLEDEPIEEPVETSDAESETDAEMV